MDAIGFLRQHYKIGDDKDWTDNGTTLKIDKVRCLMEAYANYKKQNFAKEKCKEQRINCSTCFDD